MSNSRVGVDLDDTDRALLRLLVAQPRAGMREYARMLGLARGTVQSRIARMVRRGVVRGLTPELDPAALGYAVMAFVHLHIAQGRLESVGQAMVMVPEVLEAHSITGDSDLFCRVVARDHLHLEEVVQRILGLPGVVRTRTEIALHERVSRRILPLLDAPFPTIQSKKNSP